MKAVKTIKHVTHKAGKTIKHNTKKMQHKMHHIGHHHHHEETYVDIIIDILNDQLKDSLNGMSKKDFKKTIEGAVAGMNSDLSDIQNMFKDIDFGDLSFGAFNPHTEEDVEPVVEDAEEEKVVVDVEPTAVKEAIA